MLARPFFVIAIFVEKSPMEFPQASTVRPNTCTHEQPHRCPLQPVRKESVLLPSSAVRSGSTKHMAGDTGTSRAQLHLHHH